jgi:chaperonin cofactor prefoldin
MEKRRNSDHLQQRIEDLEDRLKELNKQAAKDDPVLDAELRAIHSALPHYKEALRLELAKRAKRNKVVY